MTAGTLATLALAALGFWVFGGVVFRIAGVLLVLLGLGSAATGQPAGLLVAALGVPLWLLGHWHFALRHHHYKSPLAQRVFQLPLADKLDPTRKWVVAVEQARVQAPAAVAYPPAHPGDADHGGRPPR